MHSHMTRRVRKGCFVLPQPKTNQLHKVLIFRAASQWDSLPVNIRSIKSRYIFKWKNIYWNRCYGIHSTRMSPHACCTHRRLPYDVLHIVSFKTHSCGWLGLLHFFTVRLMMLVLHWSDVHTVFPGSVNFRVLRMHLCLYVCNVCFYFIWTPGWSATTAVEA